VRKLINQRTNFDCVVAASAMYTGLTYDECAEIYYEDMGRSKNNGMQGSEILRFLKLAGFRAVGAVGSAKRPMETIRGVPAICSVPSLNFADGTHAIYWDGYKFMDPQAFREGKKWYKPFQSADIIEMYFDPRAMKNTEKDRNLILEHKFSGEMPIK
jgi:hypothetical protein